MNRFEGKIAIITGAGTGIGFEIARQLVAEGASLILNDLDEKLAQDAASKLGNSLAFGGDASDISFIQKMVKTAVDHYGTVDFAIANAGITQFGDFFEFTEESFEKVMNLNLKGSFFLSQEVAKVLRSQKKPGKILLMSSTIGHQSIPFLACYAMSKAALKMMAKTLVSELSPFKININAIAPGATLTDRTAEENENYAETWGNLVPLKTIASPSDVAKSALFLLSGDADHITGQTLLVDGGWTSVSPPPPPPKMME
ncbi:3-oxoacyl-[acyl-carrier protein] reductase [Spirosomataceae bacterium TFI 002]|nr:3-oxoacyl-[acyl-carrier protein] reductase [Spirosomataceae bacterium TFI 002]